MKLTRIRTEHRTYEGTILHETSVSLVLATPQAAGGTIIIPLTAITERREFHVDKDGREKARA